MSELEAFCDWLRKVDPGDESNLRELIRMNEDDKCDSASLAVLHSTLQLLEKEISELNSILFDQTKSVNEIKDNALKHRDTLMSLKDEGKLLSKEIEILEKRNLMLRELPILSNEDRQKLESCRTKFMLYEECTGIVFDYTADKDDVQGFVTNQRTENVRSFSIKEDIEETLWREISKEGGDFQCSHH